MRVDAIYDHGTMKFTSPVQLRHQRFNVIVELPDEEVINETATLSQSSQEGVGPELDQILGEYRLGNSNVSPGHDKQAWHEHLERKHMK